MIEQAAFITATEEAKTLTSTLSNEQMLEIYGLFKQSLEGDNTNGDFSCDDHAGKDPVITSYSSTWHVRPKRQSQMGCMDSTKGQNPRGVPAIVH